VVDADWSHLAGRFLVLDGGEGSGKSSQCRRLVGFLRDRGLPVRHVRDPGGTPVSEKVRDLLLDPANDTMAMRCEMLLYMAARAQLVPQVIDPALNAGEVVVADRFVSSTLAYQLGGDGLTVEEIERVAQVAIAGRWPDVTILLDVPTDVAMARHVPKNVLFEGAEQVDLDRIERRPAEYHRRVRQNYLDQARRHPDRHTVIDAAQGEDAVFDAILDALRP
jgi:dTMP kinase